MMKTKFKIVLLSTISMVLLSHCASINSLSVTSIPPERSQSFKVSTHRWIILGFNFDNDYVDDLYEKIKKACPNKKATGILTKDEVYSYLLVFKRVVTATGYCVASGLK